MTHRILLVDDDPALLRALPEALELRIRDLCIDTASSGAAALARIAETDYDAVVSDIKMPGLDGLTLLSEIRSRSPATPTLLITGHGEHDLAVQALRRGAYDFVQKPIDRDYFVASLGRAIQMRQLDRRIARQKLALERHARVLEHLAEGVFFVDGGGAIGLWNAAATGITGIAAETVLGKQVEQVLPEWAGISSLIGIDELPGTAKSRPKTIPVEIGGSELWLMFSAVQFEDGVIYTFRNIIEERTFDELKTDFLTTVSHELRTPLAAIYGAAETLRRRDLEIAEGLREELLAVIAQEANRLTRIVTDILAATRLDTGYVDVASDSFDVAELAAGVIESMRLAYVDAAAIRLVAPKALPPLQTDREKLGQVLGNLIENAIKYSPSGSPVEVRIEPREMHMRLSVSDRGAGIPAHERRRIFDKFYRLDPQQSNGVGGTGLGLYICRGLVDRMQGRISVTSEPGGGSTFFVDLPLVSRVSPHADGTENVPALAVEPTIR